MNKFWSLFLVLTFGVSLDLSAQSSSSETVQLVGHLLGKKELNLQPSDLHRIEITDRHTDAQGVTFIYLRQSINDLPFFNGLASTALKDGEVVSVASNLVDHLEKRMTSNGFVLDSKEAISKLVEKTEPNVDYRASDNILKDSKSLSVANSSLSDYPIQVAKGYFYFGNGIRAVYHIDYSSLDHEHWYDAYVDANTGEILQVNDLVLHCSFGENVAHNHTKPERSMSPETQEINRITATNSYNVFAWPTESPNHGTRRVVTDPADATSSPYGWHDNDGAVGEEFTDTRGNNVWAQEDRDRNNTGGTRVDGTTDLVFDGTFDKTVSAELQTNAAIVNLFYWNNLMHDVWYHYGFDEASGNFQDNNYGNGGLGNDYVVADAQDGSGTNNANFAPFPEGAAQKPRMQMFLWSTGGGGGEKFIVESPGSIAGEYNAVQSGFGNNRLNTTPVRGKLVLVDDGSANPTLACQPISNGAAVSGNIAVIDRGSCNFDDKVLRAQNVGAIAVVMINNIGSAPIVMGGDATNITIPQVMISLADGNSLKSEMLAGDVDVVMYDSSGGGAFFFDSDFDNGVIAHEYTHGISVRLTGGASNSGCLQVAEQMGEGWSDFLSLVMTHEATDKGSDKRGIGTYLRNQATDGNGIRPFPYSTDKTINPVTYDYIKLNQFTIPHGVGSVWCSMLWDLYWGFIDVYGYDDDIYEGTGGNNMVMHLVTDGLKLQPCGPGFVSGRDAILKADELLYAGKNKLLIWQIFANRGLGYSADQGSSNSKVDGTQAFDLPPSFGGYTMDKTGPTEANAGDTILYEVKIVNIGDSPLNKINLNDTLSEKGTFLESDGRCAISFTDNTFSIEFTDLAAKDSIVCGYYVVIDTGIGGLNLYSFDFETDDPAWTSTRLSGNSTWIRTTSKANSGSYSYFGVDPASASDKTLSAEFDLTNAAKPFLVFQHSFDTEETWDGGVVEIEVNGGWKDLGPQIIQNPYNSLIENNPASNIANRAAYSGTTNGFIQSIIDLTPYAGNVTKIRFRFVSDALQGADGWYIDDVALWNGYATLTNVAAVDADGLKPKSDQVFTSIINHEVPDTVIIVIDVNEVLNVFPNPVGKELKIYFESKVERTLDLELTDMTGKSLWTGDVTAIGTTLIKTEDYADGMYILRVTDGDHVRHIKVIKKSR